ncbi:MAG: hypothetical protein SVX43_02595 [Cyanobacteriota bacterium]|nr:hypothetical protein [Cyanobacteriota bacterium]
MKFNFSPVQVHNRPLSPSLLAGLLAGLSMLAIASSVISPNASKVSRFENLDRGNLLLLPNPQLGNAANSPQGDPPPPRRPGKGGTT